MEENHVQEDKSSQQISIERTDHRDEDKREETSKKPKQASKQSLKAAKPTIPQPITLSTEERIVQEKTRWATIKNSNYEQNVEYLNTIFSQLTSRTGFYQKV
ncbi:density-regulated protein [Corchorus capsularis]|uniref:Density-regulated protein n=1 Tax=Corchorus capsularis TaxID=210143 RepID=A0A1R3GQ34_COCAP|nr:density-regulated protein [Corchorus capsularis]